MLSTELKDYNIVATSAQKEASLSEIQVKYIDSLVNHLKDRFPHVELLGAFSIFDPQNVPSDEEQLTTYCQDEARVLLATYGEGSDPVVDTEKFTSEWECFKRLMKNSYTSKTMRSFCVMKVYYVICFQNWQTSFYWCTHFCKHC